MTTQAIDLKFAGAAVQKLLLVMVALSKISFVHSMVGFVMEGHI